MLDVTELGTPNDEPADPSQLQGGKSASIFALLKFIALQLYAMNEDPAHAGNAGE
jgi:hypothetical protein